MTKMPKIIHQIWGGDKPLPGLLKQLSDGLQAMHFEWVYQFWDDEIIDQFVKDYYPQYYEAFNRFPYSMQRWDTIRYMILYKIGGLYIDFDTECFAPLDELVIDKSCWFSLEPEESAKINNKPFQLSPAIMGAVPGHPFIEYTIDYIFEKSRNYNYDSIDNKVMDVVRTTGPLMLTNSYESYLDKEGVCVIPKELITYFHHNETAAVLNERVDEKLEEVLEKRLENAYVVHYFFYDWFNI